MLFCGKVWVHWNNVFKWKFTPHEEFHLKNYYKLYQHVFNSLNILLRQCWRQGITYHIFQTCALLNYNMYMVKTAVNGGEKKLTPFLWNYSNYFSLFCTWNKFNLWMMLGDRIWRRAYGNTALKPAVIQWELEHIWSSYLCMDLSYLN